ncbi:MAG: hypothetical protein IH801_04630, partial [Nitrospinae bacterium]|nr:hypothetical protein [Nitrospinota bacterium]
TMSKAALYSRSATDIATGVASGEFSAAEVLAAALGRIEAVNPTVNAIVTLNGNAMAEAEACDRRLRAGGPARPLEGVPFVVKDILHTKGIRTTFGSDGREEEGAYSERAEPLVKERDYVKLKYRYEDSELYETKAIVEQSAAMDEKELSSLPNIPGVQTVAGRLVLLAIRDGLRAASHETMERLIEANEQVRQIKPPKKPKKKK